MPVNSTSHMDTIEVLAWPHSTFDGVHFSQIDMAASKIFDLQHLMTSASKINQEHLVWSHNLQGDSEI
jgi:hypothetical protein